MRRRAQGPRPTHFPDPVSGPMFTMTMTLAQEISVVRERLDTVERLLSEGQQVTTESIERYTPSDAARAEREALRDDLVRRLFRVVSEDLSRGQFTSVSTGTPDPTTV